MLQSPADVSPETLNITKKALFNKRHLAILGLILATFCWGGNSVAGRFSVGEVPPVALAFWRWIIAFLILLPFTAKQIVDQRKLIFRKKKQLLLLAVFSITSFNTLLYFSAQTTPAVNIGLIQTALPVIAMLLSIPLLKTWPNRYQVFGAVVAFPGLLLIFSDGNFNNLARLQFGQGDLIMMLATVFWGIYTVLLKRFALPLSEIVQLTVLIGVGVTLLAPFYLWELMLVGRFEVSREVIFLYSYVVLFPSLVAYICWNYGVRTLGASNAAMFNFLMPVFAATMAIPILGETLQTWHFFSAGLIFTGLWFSSRKSVLKSK